MKRILSIIIGICLAACLAPLGAGAEEPVSWSLDGGTLAITGSGDMAFKKIPWADRLGEIQALRLDEGITAIQDVVGRILARAEEEPAVIAGLDRLTAYYLPTTVKLLDAYDRLEEEPIQGENISSSRSEIEHTLEVLHSAFEKLFDDTYQDLSLDVSADISVLHAMLAQEGLTEGPFDVKP